MEGLDDDDGWMRAHGVEGALCLVWLGLAWLGDYSVYDEGLMRALMRGEKGEGREERGSKQRREEGKRGERGLNGFRSPACYMIHDTWVVC